MSRDYEKPAKCDSHYHMEIENELLYVKAFEIETSLSDIIEKSLVNGYDEEYADTFARRFLNTKVSVTYLLPNHMSLTEGCPNLIGAAKK